MSRQFLTGLNLNKNELLNARIQNLALAPQSPVSGQIYYNTTDNTLRYYNGTSWLTLAQGGSVETAIQTAIDALTTSDIEEGSNLYFTDQRAKDAAATLLTGSSQTNISITGDGNGLTITAENGVADSTTDDLTEGTTNLYFTNQRAIDAVGGSATYYNTPDTVMKRDGFGQTEIGQIYVTDGIRFEPYDGGDYSGRFLASGGQLSIEGGTSGLDITAGSGNLVINANSGDVEIHPDGNLHVWSSVISTNNIYGRQSILGGPDNGNDGNIYVYDVDGNTTFAVESGSETATMYGSLRVGPANTGYTVLNITDDGSGNAVIDGWNNNLILRSDSGNNGIYLGNVSDDNRVVTQGGAHTLTNKTLSTGTYLGDNLNSDGYRITNLSDPQDPQDAATKAYVDNVAAGLTWKAAVNLLWDDPNAGLTGTTGTLAIDGHAALTSAQQGYRILITSGINAGIWYYADDGVNWGLTRTEDADVFTELKGATVFIEEGDVYGQSAWTQGNHYITDFTNQDWVQFSGAAQIVAGAGLTKTGNQLDVNGTANRITVNADSVDIASTYVGQSSITTVGTITSGEWNGTTISIADGGTGATTAAGARENLGAVTKYAVNNPTLTAVSGSVTWTVTHNLGTEDVTVQLKDISSKQLVEVDVEITNQNTVTLSWVSGNVVDDTFRVVVVG